MDRKDNLNVKEMVERSLREGGYDGLFSKVEDCGCFLGDLFPCTTMPDKCRAGYAWGKTPECSENCEDAPDCLGQCVRWQRQKKEG